MFTSDYKKVIEKVESFDVAEYAKSRNFIEGGVSRLSPYLTHGFLALPILKKYAKEKSENESFIYELGWREYFQKVFSLIGNKIFADLQPYKTGLSSEHYQKNFMPEDVLKAETGIAALDEALRGLYAEGYMHNHARMWFASYLIHYRRIHWKTGADFFFYHLLDGDLASNTLGWQWVASTFSSKPYIFNQANLNKFSLKSARQTNTFFDKSYEELHSLLFSENSQKFVSIENLISRDQFLDLEYLKDFKAIRRIRKDNYENLVWLHPWMLDPLAEWAKDENSLKAFIVDPVYFAEFPFSEKRLNFMMNLIQENFEDYLIILGSPSEQIQRLSREFNCQTIITREYFDDWYKRNSQEISSFGNFKEENYPFAFRNKPLGRLQSFSGWWRKN